jgi:dephospho-CoA kinase
MALIGLVGFIGSGKGTVGDILEQKGFEKDSFAKPLKDACSFIFGWPRSLLEGDTEVSRKWRELPDPFWSEKFGFKFTPREALQLLGTEAGRNVFHPDIWVISLLNRANGRKVVVTDVRFGNEIDYIQKNGGKIVRIIRGEEPIWYQKLAEIDDKNERHEYMSQFPIHSSEWDWVGSTFDHIIYNDGTYNDLEAKVDEMLKKLF